VSWEPANAVPREEPGSPYPRLSLNGAWHLNAKGIVSRDIQLFLFSRELGKPGRAALVEPPTKTGGSRVGLPAHARFVRRDHVETCIRARRCAALPGRSDQASGRVAFVANSAHMAPGAGFARARGARGAASRASSERHDVTHASPRDEAARKSHAGVLLLHMIIRQARPIC
jgi:hypothetical protein